MLTKLYNMLCRCVHTLLGRPAVKLAIVRRYCDANGAYVGELYLWRAYGHGGAYEMIGASLDTLPFNLKSPLHVSELLDTKNDFLAPMPPNRIRVGATVPKYNDAVRKMVAAFPRRGMQVAIQNRFIEYVLEGKRI